VGVGARHEDAALVLDALHERFDVEAPEALLLCSGGDVLEIDEYGEVGFQGVSARGPGGPGVALRFSRRPLRAMRVGAGGRMAASVLHAAARCVTGSPLARSKGCT